MSLREIRDEIYALETKISRMKKEGAAPDRIRKLEGRLSDLGIREHRLEEYLANIY